MNGELDDIRSILDDWERLHGCAASVCRIPIDECERTLPDLSEQERGLLDSHRHPARRRAWLGGRRAAKDAARRWAADPMGVSRDAEILREPSGRPVIADRAQLHLTIAHSGEYAVAAVASRALGIDIERIEDRPDSLLRTFYSAVEREWVRQDPSMRSRRCDQIWTRKEAVSKLLGKGGQMLFSGISVLDGSTPWILETAATQSYTLSLAFGREA